MIEVIRQYMLEEMPDKPKQGEWYRCTTGGLCANGEPYYGAIKLGRENKLLVLLCGGGFAIDEYTASRPNSLYNEAGTLGFYFDDTFVWVDVCRLYGILSAKKENPFRDWTCVIAGYASGDFHCGDGDYFYRDAEGREQSLRCHGRRHLNALIDRAKRFMPAPDRLCIAGYSAGGFGTALMSEEIIGRFPDCKDVTCLIDGAHFLREGWQKIARDVWHAPEEICARLAGEDLVFGCLQALRARHKEVKLGFVCSSRDALLAQGQCFFAEGEMQFHKLYGEKVRRDLAAFVEGCKRQIGAMYFYIYDAPSAEAPGACDLTQHCVIASANAFEICSDGIKVMAWLKNLIEGRSGDVGLSLLTEEQ